MATEHFEPMTKHTITSRDIFRRELERVRRQGFATCQEEMEIGTTSVAVPIVGPKKNWFAAIGMSGSSSRMNVDFMPVALNALNDAAAAISASMFKVNTDERVRALPQ
jgi:DNA-binding IclR family transcriptional regulator